MEKKKREEGRKGGKKTALEPSENFTTAVKKFR